MTTEFGTHFSGARRKRDAERSAGVSSAISSRAEWPMADYIQAWRAFRESSDENERTVEHILAQPLWPGKKRNLRVVDLGCGDGRLIEVLSRHVNGCDITLVEPEENLLLEAGARLISSHTASTVTSIHARAEEHRLRSVLYFADVVLAVHLLYLMLPETVARIVETLSPGVPHFFVLDDPDSLFTTLWEQTAPRYHKRVHLAHRLLTSLPTTEYHVRRTTFESRLVNPNALTEEMRSQVISLLCYASYPDLKPRIRQWVDRRIKSRLRSEHLWCRCACYEVVHTPGN